MSYYRQQLEDWLQTLEVKADLVLDIGGKQLPVKNRVKSWDVKDYKILDLPEYDVEYGFAGYESSGTARYRGKADLVFCLEVFEYLIDPLQAFSNIRKVLKPGGRAFVTFPFVYPHHNELERDSLRYTEPGIRRLAGRTKLSVSKFWYRTDKSGLLQSFYQADGMKMAKEYPHHQVTGFVVEFSK